MNERAATLEDDCVARERDDRFLDDAVQIRTEADARHRPAKRYYRHVPLAGVEARYPTGTRALEASRTL
jgi:hypothetical protein